MAYSEKQNKTKEWYPFSKLPDALLKLSGQSNVFDIHEM